MYRRSHKGYDYTLVWCILLKIEQHITKQIIRVH